jgi:hypothetical protein
MMMGKGKENSAALPYWKRKKPLKIPHGKRVLISETFRFPKHEGV